MGSPKRIRKKYDTPSMMWDIQRIEEEHKLKEQYGLKNLKELWIAASELRRIRGIARGVLSGNIRNETGEDLIKRLVRYSIVKRGATLDDLLVISPEALLDRRLQSVVLKKGLAKTMKQARQLITHGFIAIGGMRVTSPGRIVSIAAEQEIGYYKPIKVFEEPRSSAIGDASGIAEATAVGKDEVGAEVG